MTGSTSTGDGAARAISSTATERVASGAGDLRRRRSLTALPVVRRQNTLRDRNRSAKTRLDDADRGAPALCREGYEKITVHARVQIVRNPGEARPSLNCRATAGCPVRPASSQTQRRPQGAPRRDLARAPLPYRNAHVRRSQSVADPENRSAARFRREQAHFRGFADKTLVDERTSRLRSRSGRRCF